jgi:hypothetical protein
MGFVVKEFFGIVWAMKRKNGMEESLRHFGVKGNLRKRKIVKRFWRRVFHHFHKILQI